MDYDEAKAAFFQELSCPEEGLVIYIRAVAGNIRSHVEEVYLAKSFDGKIQQALEQVIQTAGKAREVARALEQPTQEKKYDDWQEQAAALLAQVGNQVTRSHIQLPILSGGKRRTKHFLETKLPIDSAIIAIESALDGLHHSLTLPPRRVYHGAGLLYYLGYEKYPSWLIKDGEPFPDRLEARTDGIHGIYCQRRKEARKYLSHEAVADLIQQAHKVFVEHENQSTLDRAILTELLRK